MENRSLTRYCYHRNYCRRAGITIHSAMDCLITLSVLENGLSLLHEDRDYLRMQSHVPAPRQENIFYSLTPLPFFFTTLAPG